MSIKTKGARLFVNGEEVRPVMNVRSDRVFTVRPVTRENAGELYAPVDQYGCESGITPSHNRELMQSECDRLNEPEPPDNNRW